MVLPTPQEIFGLEPPFFLRKLNRKSDWGVDGDDTQLRLKIALQKVFPNSSKVSVYQVETDEDLYRVAIGLNANRSSLTEQLDVVAFTPNELNNCKIQYSFSKGETKCLGANQCHFDLIASDKTLEGLCTLAFQNNRKSIRFNKTKMKKIKELLASKGCYATTEESICCECEQSSE